MILSVFRTRQWKPLVAQQYSNVVFEKSTRLNESEIIFAKDAKIVQLVHATIDSMSEHSPSEDTDSIHTTTSDNQLATPTDARSPSKRHRNIPLITISNCSFSDIDYSSPEKHGHDVEPYVSETSFTADGSLTEDQQLISFSSDEETIIP